MKKGFLFALCIVCFFCMTCPAWCTSEAAKTPLQKLNDRLNDLDSAIRAGKRDNVDKEISALVSQYAKDPVILQNIGAWCGRHNNHEKAFEVFCRASKALRLKEKKDPALAGIIEMNQHSAFEKIKASDSCLMLLEKLRRENPALLPSEAYVFLGQQYSNSGEAEKEMAVYESALDPFFEIPEFHFNLSQLLKKKGRIREAIVELQWATNVDPASPHLREFSFAMFPLMDSTRNKCRNDTGFARNNVELCTFLDAYEYMTTGPVHRAIYKLKECIDQNPEEPLYHLYLGELYTKSGNHGAAYGELRRTQTALIGRTSSFYRGALELGDAIYRTIGVESAKLWWTDAAQNSLVPWVREQANRRLRATGN